MTTSNEGWVTRMALARNWAERSLRCSETLSILASVWRWRWRWRLCVEWVGEGVTSYVRKSATVKFYEELV